MNELIEPCVGFCVFVHARIVVNSSFLAQASMSRLGEINRGCPSCFTQAVAQATHVLFERVSVSSKREGSRLSEIPREATVPLFEPSPRRGGIAWVRASRLSETLQPKRGAGRGSVVLGCLLFSDDWHLLGYDCYDKKYVVNYYVWVIWFMDGEWWVWNELGM